MVDLEYRAEAGPRIVFIGNVNIAGGIHRDSGRIGQSRGGGRTAVAARMVVATPIASNCIDQPGGMVDFADTACPVIENE